MGLYNEVDKETKAKENQMRYEYAMYIMLTSYFKKGSFKGQFVESQFKVNYAGVSSTKQGDIEEVVLDCIDKVIIPKLKVKNIEDKEVVFSTKNVKDTNKHLLIFSGEGFEFSMIITPSYNKGKNKEFIMVKMVSNKG